MKHLTVVLLALFFLLPVSARAEEPSLDDGASAWHAEDSGFSEWSDGRWYSASYGDWAGIYQYYLNRIEDTLDPIAYAPRLPRASLEAYWAVAEAFLSSRIAEGERAERGRAYVDYAYGNCSVELHGWIASEGARTRNRFYARVDMDEMFVRSFMRETNLYAVREPSVTPAEARLLLADAYPMELCWVMSPLDGSLRLVYRPASEERYAVSANTGERFTLSDTDWFDTRLRDAESEASDCFSDLAYDRRPFTDEPPLTDFELLSRDELDAVARGLAPLDLANAALDQSHTLRVENGAPFYTLTYFDESGYRDVTLDARTGALVSYSRYDRTSGYAGATVDPDEGRVIADGILAELAPALASHVRLTDTDVSRNPYIYTYCRWAGGAPYRDNFVQIRLFAHTGELCDFDAVWTQVLLFPKVDETQDADDARSAYLDAAGVTLSQEGRAYYALENPDIVIDARTLEAIPADDALLCPLPYSDASLSDAACARRMRKNSPNGSRKPLTSGTITPIFRFPTGTGTTGSCIGRARTKP